MGNNSKTLNTIDGRMLMEAELKPLDFVVDTLLAQGLHILAGSPKVGKSWLALWLAVAVAKGESVWGMRTKDIRAAMERSCTQEQFIARMMELGYGVKWETGHKYITYTTPENIRCRDSKLFDSTLTRENMERYFEMGGAAYLESRQQAAALNGETAPVVDDVVNELGSALDALLSDDTTRFHMETVYHSEDEIQRMLAMGQKLTRTEVAVQDDDGEEKQRRIEAELRAAAELSEQAMRRMLDGDEEQQEFEDEEFEQYHGFGMSMGMS